MPLWAGIAVLSLIVWLLAGSVPAALVQLLWPMSLVVPALATFLRARRQDWTSRWRRGAVVDVIVALLLAGAMMFFQLGRAEGDAVSRGQLNAALLLAVGQPSWLLWCMYDSLMLFLRERRG